MARPTRRTLVAAFSVLGAVALMASSAAACTHFFGTMEVTGNGTGSVTAKATGANNIGPSGGMEWIANGLTAGGSCTNISQAPVTGVKVNSSAVFTVTVAADPNLAGCGNSGANEAHNSTSGASVVGSTLTDGTYQIGLLPGRMYGENDALWDPATHNCHTGPYPPGGNDALVRPIGVINVAGGAGTTTTNPLTNFTAGTYSICVYGNVVASQSDAMAVNIGAVV